MAINIKNREAETLIDEIRAATGKGTTEIVLLLARQEAERLRRAMQVEERRRRIDAICAEAAALIPPGAPSADEIVGYDENGLPT